MQNVVQIKERIVSIIQERGPSLPVQIAKEINVAPLFSSVFLSELYNDNKIKMSDMKVGSSSLFYIIGQEPLLEKFVEHLNPREKEAFFLIKKEEVLEDEKQTPVMRVALRAIKDFAIPLKVQQNDQQKIVWRYFLIPESEIKSRIEQKLSPKPQKKELEPEVQKKIEITSPETLPKKEIEEKPKKDKKKREPSAEPSRDIKGYLASKNIEILETQFEKKKEALHKVRVDTTFGKQTYYLSFKDKKKITDTDLALALQKAQNEKMPAVFLSPGELDKKAQEYLKSWKELIKFEKLN